MKKINLTIAFFTCGLLMLIFSSLIFGSGHFNVGNKVIAFTYLLLFLGSLSYLFKAKNEK